MRAVIVKAVKPLLLVFCLLVAVEVLLQLAGLLVQEQAWRAKAAWLTGDFRVLAVGDSNTYGLYLAAEESYPAQLESQWNRQHPKRPIEVINVGYPGTNSFRLLANLPDLLDTFQPDLVLLLIGFNDFWTVAEELQPEEGDFLSGLKYRSRLYKLYDMFMRQRDLAEQVDTGERQGGDRGELTLSDKDVVFLETQSGYSLAELQAMILQYQQDPASLAPEVKTEIESLYRQLLQHREKNKTPQEHLNVVQVGEKVFSLGILQEGQQAGHSKHLQENLLAMFTLLGERAVSVIVMNYPTRHSLYPSANKKIAGAVKAFSQQQQRQPVFVDLNQLFPDHCAEKPDSCPEILFYDGHATAQGNRQVATKVAAAMTEMLLE